MAGDPDERAWQIYSRLCGLDRAAWDGVLARECGRDVELRQRVDSLIEHGEAAEREGLLADPALAQQRAASALGFSPPDRAGSRGRAGLEAGSRLGDFRIVREVGRGGMGVVYEAEQISLSRTVALKVLESHPLQAPRAIERFLREAEVIAGLDHPSMVTIHLIGEDQGVRFFAMSLVEGAPLDRVLRRLSAGAIDSLSAARLFEAIAAERIVPASRTVASTTTGLRRNKSYVAEVCQIVVQVAEALHHAHEHEIIHRDVKPSNILVQTDGRAVLTDFGLARPIDRVDVTRTGEFAGTPAYVSPEQVGRKKLDRRTDIFSLGVTLYELITLRRPFDADTTVDLMARIVAREPAMPRRLNPRIPRDVETICLTALEKDPARRYATAGEMAADLGRFLAYEPIQARPLGAAARAWRWARRNPAPTLAIVLPVVLTVAGSLSFSVYQIKVNEEIRLEQGRTLKEAERARRENAGKLVGRGRLAAQRGLWQDALADYGQALKGGYPDAIELRLLMVEAWQGQFDDERALRELEAIVGSTDPGRHRAKALLLQGFSRMQVAGDSPAGTDLIRRAFTLGGLDAADQALAEASLAATVPRQIDLLRKALAADPYHHAAQVALAHVLVLMGEFDQARELVLSFQARYPDDPAALFLRGILCAIDPARKQEAVRVVADLRARGWSRPAANLTLWIWVYDQAAQLDEEMSRYCADLATRGVRIETSLTYWLRLLPRIASMLMIAPSSGGKQPATRGPNMFTAIPSGVSRVLGTTALRLTGWLLSKPSKERSREAIRRLDEAIEVYPIGVLYMVRGMARLLDGHLVEAERDFLLAHGACSPFPVRRVPLMLAALLQLSRAEAAEVTAGERQAAALRARRSIEMMLDSAASNGPARRFTAAGALELGEIDLAGEIAARWRREVPGDPEALLVQARVLLARGALAAAREACDEVLTGRPDDAEALGLRRQILGRIERGDAP